MKYSSMLKDLPPLIIDPEAQTIEELANKTGRSMTTVTRFAHDQVDSHKWERVFKMVKGKRQPAYRPKAH